MKSKDVNMLSGSVTKGLITLALPIMIMNVGQTLFNVIDMTVLKIFSGRLSSIMSDTPEVIRFSQQKMIIISSTYFLHGINEILGGTLKGMGRPIIPAVATLLYMCLFRFVWVYVIYPFCPQNLTFLYLVWPVGWILCIVTLLVFYILSVKKVQSELS